MRLDLKFGKFKISPASEGSERTLDFKFDETLFSKDYKDQSESQQLSSKPRPITRESLSKKFGSFKRNPTEVLS